MRKVHLHGALGKEFGASHQFDVRDIPDAIQALIANFSNFASKIRGGFYKVIVGDKKTGVEMDEQSVATYSIGNNDIHIIPVTQGRGRGGLGKILAGVLLIGLAVFTGGTALMSAGLFGSTTTLGGILTSVGTGLVMTGVASILAPSTETKESDPSFTMSGPQTTLREGGIIPIVYGECIVGGVMISGILRIENKVDATTPPAGNSTTFPIVFNNL